MTEVLLVEDSPTQALRLKLILEREGLKVSVARNGREGIAMATLLLPQAVVLDVNLPDIDGFHVCQALKDHPATWTTPIIMLTVKDRAADALAGLDSGADAYIPKDDFAEVNLQQALGDLGVLQPAVARGAPRRQPGTG
jgi:DNA-binding response OmpR family regulator